MCVLLHMLRDDEHAAYWMLRSLRDICFVFKSRGTDLEFSVSMFSASEKEEEDFDLLAKSPVLRQKVAFGQRLEAKSSHGGCNPEAERTALFRPRALRYGDCDKS